MAPKFPFMTQADYLYDSEWDAGADNLFIEVLVDQYLIGNFKKYYDNEHAISIGRDVVNSEFGKSFTQEYCMQRCEILRKRYQVFSWILRKPGVRYDLFSNTTSAPDFVWDEIYKVNDFGLAYQTFGDPTWKELCQLFYNRHENSEVNDFVDELISPIGKSHHDLVDGGFDNNIVIPSCLNLAEYIPPSPPSHLHIFDSKPLMNNVPPKKFTSVSSSERSLWNYVEKYACTYSNTSESSVNQPEKPPQSAGHPLNYKLKRQPSFSVSFKECRHLMLLQSA